MRSINPLKLTVAIVICELAGIIGAMYTAPSIPLWYAGLVKPALTPPAWIFGPVWTILYVLKGTSAYLIWEEGIERKDVKAALSLFGFQLLLNVLWSIVFFDMENPGAAFTVIVVLWLFIIATVRYFYKISRPAAWILIPYLLWVTFAMYLNYSIWMLNSI